MSEHICYSKMDYYHTIQFTGDNTDAVLEFLSHFSPKMEEDNAISYLPDFSETCKRRYVQVGDFIVRPSGYMRIDLYSEKDFNEWYFIDYSEGIKNE